MARKKLTWIVDQKGAKKTARDMGKVDNSLANAAKTAMKFAGAYIGAQGVISVVKSSITAFGEQEDAERQLKQAVGDSADSLIAQAGALQQVTTFGDEKIIQAQTLIGSFVDEEDQVKKATKATLDLAAAKGMDLKAAADLVSKTLGSSTNAMSRYGIEVEGTVGSSERLESLTENIAEVFGGQAAAQAETMAGSMKQAENAIGDTAEAIGKLLSPVVIDVAGWLKTAAEQTNKFFENIGKTEFERTIGQLEDLGLATLQYKESIAEVEVAEAKLKTEGLEEREVLQQRLTNQTKNYKGIMTLIADEQQRLVEGGLSETQIRRKIHRLAGADLMAAEAKTDALQDSHEEEIKILRDRLESINTLKEERDTIKENYETTKDQLDVYQEVENKQRTLEAIIESIAGTEEGRLEDAKVLAEVMSKISIGVDTEGLEETGTAIDEYIIKPIKLADENVKEVETDVSVSLPEAAAAAIPGVTEAVGIIGSQYSQLHNMRMQQMRKEKQTSIQAENKRYKQRKKEIKNTIKDDKKKKKALKKAKQTHQDNLDSIDDKAADKKKDLLQKQKKWKIAETIISTYTSAQKAYESLVGLGPVGPFLAAAAAAAVVAAGLQRVSMISSQKYAKGGSFETQGPELIMVGDNPGGRERVDVTPLSSRNERGPQGGDTLQIIIQGDFVGTAENADRLAEIIEQRSRQNFNNIQINA